MSEGRAGDINPAHCPLCGEPNQCAMAADPEAAECWCESEKFPQDLVARVSTNAVGRVCICRSCVAAHHEENSN